MKILVIEESKWLHGDKWKSVLLNDDGKMCCLGFLAKSYGASDDYIRGKGTPESAQNVKWHPALLSDKINTNQYGFDTDLCRSIIVVNDRHETTDCEFDPELLLLKKQELSELFKTMDIKLEFVP